MAEGIQFIRETFPSHGIGEAMRDLVTVVCFVSVLMGLGMAERLYLKWKTYVTCSEVNLLVAQGQFEKTLEIIKSRNDLLLVDTIDDAVEICRSPAS